MSVEQMRKAIEKVYYGDRWRQRVAKMPDEQVIAVYRRFLNDRKIK